MKGKFFKFYGCCKIVVGAKRSAIYDLPRGNFFFLPNVIVEVLKEYEHRGIQKLFNDYSEQKKQLKKYFDYLLENELIFLTDYPENFPEIETGLQKPYYLDFLTIEIEHLQKFKIEFLEKSIDISGVEHIILINSSNSLENLKVVLKILYSSRIKVVTYISLFQDNLIEPIKKIKAENERLKDIIFYSSSYDFTDSENKIKYTLSDLKELYNKRIENINSFTLNPTTFLESQNKNLYFNRRAYIGNNGDIKPSYFHRNEYGNLEINKLIDVVLKSDFQKIWNVNKDNIEVCKDCEFRYMCPDNRIPTEKDNQFFHETFCNYNPYKNIWSS